LAAVEQVALGLQLQQTELHLFLAACPLQAAEEALIGMKLLQQVAETAAQVVVQLETEAQQVFQEMEYLAKEMLAVAVKMAVLATAAVEKEALA
jgi:hypothetical protein